MINRQQLLNALKSLLKRIETDLRERAEAQGDAPEIHKKLTTEYERARKAERTAATFEQWRSEQIMQKGVAWILSCVFARFLEDNQLVDPPRIAGPKDLLKRARDEHELYFRNHPKETDREYLLDGFSKLSNLPGGREIFGKHNAIHVYPGWLSGDAAGELLTFFQAIDPGTGELVHDFTDGQWDTRFLGDLYQDLSEAARKKYALLQTPDFVEAFILDRTLEPALDEFGLNAPPVKNRNGDEIAPVGFRMIDPACGSGHFLLGTFDRIFERLLKTEPAANSRDLAQRTLNSIYGVDVNPFAVAIAKFRLLLLAMKACKIGTLSSCPAFVLNVACGDSLLHGEGVMHQMEIAPGPISHCYETEDAQTLRQILKLNIYHAVVANPPYIAVKDHLLNQAYRDRFRTCYGKYALSVPFMQRIFYLGVQGVDDGTQSAGYTGQITANSFMKRQFGKKLVEEYIQNLDLTHVIDTSGAYIPGHGTPTVIIFGRNRKPIGRKIRTAMGIRGEPGTPTDPAKGKVWSMILKQIDSPDSESLYVSVTDIKRFRFYSHPWSIGGGGASELKDFIDLRGHSRLSDHASNIGVQAVTLADEAFAAPGQHLKRYGINTKYLRPFIEGDSLRHWIAVIKTNAIFPYEGVSLHPYLTLNVKHRLWPLKTLLTNRKMFRRTQSERGLNWFEYGMLIRKKYRNEPAITFSSVATHNHFVYLNSNAVFTQSAPLVLFRKKIGEDISLGLLGTLNTALACFWMKQVFHCKGSTVDNKGARQTTVPFEDFYDFDSTKLKKFPILANIPSLIAKQLQNILQTFPIPSLDEGNNYHQTYNADKRTQWLKTLHKLIFLGEELD
ncbi:MAG: BREX-2 system adenine-specific DNA-methyltransferase PglX, partial [Deltaproteobacteria bacterium]|nr:BREX-2 system adenine-specific DNA-methyltransferase PglX [Deltaproteobacteria bacterium]